MKRTFILYPDNTVFPPDTPQRRVLAEQRSKDIRKAIQLYPHIPSTEDAYFAYCRENNIKYITQNEIHFALAAARQDFITIKQKRFICNSCGEQAVTLTPLCPSCEQFARGFRTTLLCEKCLFTEFSPKSMQELLGAPNDE
jgi:predicted amidophosphoribosyltransferase